MPSHTHTHTSSSLTHPTHSTHLTHSTPPSLGCRRCLPINLVEEELLKNVANQWSGRRLESGKKRMTLYCSYWPSHVPRPEDVGGGYPHTIVCFGFLGLASRAALLTALLKGRGRERTKDMRIQHMWMKNSARQCCNMNHHSAQSPSPDPSLSCTRPPLSEGDTGQLDKGPRRWRNQNQVLI